MSNDPLLGLDAELQSALQAVHATTSLADIEGLSTKYLGRNGLLNARFSGLSELPPSIRRVAGDRLNAAKRTLTQAIETHRRAIHTPDMQFDLTLPGAPWKRGRLHPLTAYARRVRMIWQSLGYAVHDGPELEDEWYNFDGLNVPKDHPARDIQDTFFIKNEPRLVLRTHSSTVQLRALKHHAPSDAPVRYVEIGKVYRNEATDATHESMFMQCDGVFVDHQVTMGHLIATLELFIHRLFPTARTRVRPSFFPFVEPGMELDVWYEAPGQKPRWMELLGAGLVHPNVIKAMGRSPSHWQGFAFGMGLDRLAMLEYGVHDVRVFYGGDPRLIQRF